MDRLIIEWTRVRYRRAVSVNESGAVELPPEVASRVKYRVVVDKKLLDGFSMTARGHRPEWFQPLSSHWSDVVVLERWSPNLSEWTERTPFGLARKLPAQVFGELLRGLAEWQHEPAYDFEADPASATYDLGDIDVLESGD